MYWYNPTTRTSERVDGLLVVRGDYTCLQAIQPPRRS
jgi:hypothetical protein